MLHRFFPLLKSAPLTENIRSRDACIYLDRGMKVAGWLTPKSRGWEKVWAVVANTSILVIMPLSLILSYITDFEKFTPGEFLTSLQMTINSLGSGIKVGFAFAGIPQFKKVKNLLDILDKRCTCKKQRLELHPSVALCNRIFIFYQGLYTGCVIVATISTAISGYLPYNMYNPFVNAEESRAKFFIAATIELMLMGGCALMQQLVDVYAVIYLTILRAHMRNLKERVRVLRADPDLTERQNYAELVKCIQDHRLILEALDTLRSPMSGTIFVQFLLIGVILGVALMNILFFWNMRNGPRTCIYIVTLIIQTFPVCYMCDVIAQESEDLAIALFQSNWIGAEKPYMKSLLYFLHIAHKTITFNAGGIFTICIRTNIQVAKFAFTVITIVDRMNLTDKFRGS